MKKIGFVAHGPASANSLWPIIKKIEKEVEVVLFAYHPYVSNLWNCKQIESKEYPEGFAELDLVVYGTGSHNPIELNVPIAARQYGFPSVSILDCYWVNEENLKLRFFNKPTYIITPNEEAKQKVQQLNLISEENIIPLGNPHFDRLGILKEQVEAVKYPLDMVFFSQCAEVSDYSDTHPVCKEILRSLVLYQNENLNKVRSIVVAPHPRENQKWLREFCSHHNLLIKENQSLSLMLESDISVGMHCTLQYEAEIIGKPTVFYISEEQMWSELTHVKEKVEPSINGFSATDKCVSFLYGLLDLQ